MPNKARYQQRKRAGLCTVCGKKAKKNRGKCHKCIKTEAIRKTAWTKANPDKHSEYNKRCHLKTKREVFRVYGGAFCKCCGEDIEEFLTMDHTKGNGNKHRIEEDITNIYDWLKSHGFPPGYQVLCSNCQNRWKCPGGICPHKHRAHHPPKQ